MDQSAENISRNVLYPVFLKLDKFDILIVGGGDAGAEKMRYIMKSSPNARVTLVAPEFIEEVAEIAGRHEQVIVHKRNFEEGDLNGKKLVIVATDDRELNKEIRELAVARNILTNVADTPDLCDFYLGSIVTKGDLKVAISTNGKSPTFAKRFRMLLEDILPENITETLDRLKTIRDSLKGDFQHKIDVLNQITSNLIEKNDKNGDTGS